SSCLAQRVSFDGTDGGSCSVARDGGVLPLQGPIGGLLPSRIFSFKLPLAPVFLCRKETEDLLGISSEVVVAVLGAPGCVLNPDHFLLFCCQHGEKFFARPRDSLQLRKRLKDG